MNKLNFRRKQGTPPCEEMREDDGINPRYERKDNNFKNKRNYQNVRLCKQIETVLMLLFSGGCEDERFSSLCVESVKFQSNMSFVTVTVFPLYSMPVPDPEAIMLFLESVKNYLRFEVAAEINRKRMPEFRFKVIIDPTKFLN